MSDELRSEFYRVDWDDSDDIEEISTTCPEEAIQTWWDGANGNDITDALFSKYLKVVGYNSSGPDSNTLVPSGEVLEVDFEEWCAKKVSRDE